METKQKTFIQELFARRIPQIIGMYIAAVWLAVEIGDWVSERFSISDQLSSFIFIGMLTLLPSVILLSWGHGKPGKDRWTKSQFILIPLNIAFSLFAISYLIKPVTAASSPLTLMSMYDEAGKPVAYETVKKGFHQPILMSFWDNKSGQSTLDWLEYASAWLLDQDLQRSPVISSVTPYDSASVLNDLRGRGFAKAAGSPLSLDLKIASDRSYKWLVRGEIQKLNNGLTEFTAYLYDVMSGKEIKKVTSSSDDWLFSLDQISHEIFDEITKDLSDKSSLIPELSISEHTTKSDQALRHMINSENAVAFDNDYEIAIKELKSSLENDTGFVNAHVSLMLLQRDVGDFAKASYHGRQALMLDYKLYQETAFLVKAVLYVLDADMGKTLKVLENWVKVYPESTQALTTLADTYIQVGNHIGDAKSIYERLYVLEPDRDKTLIDLSNIYRLEGNGEQAIKLLEEYVKLNPDKADAYLYLADTHFQFGRFEEAKRAFEEAVIYDSNNMKAAIGLIKVRAARGDYSGAFEELELLRSRAVTDNDHYQILDFREFLLYSTGQIKASMKNLEEWQTYADKLLPPLGLLFNFSAKRVAYLAISNRAEEAVAYTKKVKNENTGPVAQFVDLFFINIYQELGDLDNYVKAANRFEEFLEEYPLPNVAQFQLAGRAKVAYWNQQYGQSLSYYDQAIEESRQSITTLNEPKILNDLIYERANVLYQSGDHKTAVEELLELTVRNPFDGRALLLLALCHNDLNQPDARDKVISKLDKLWEKADPDYKEYKKFLQFKHQLNQEVDSE